MSKKPPYRPSVYSADLNETVRKLALLGATDKEMADILGIAESTFHKWKIDHPVFSESITRGKVIADSEVAERLYQRALGYSHKAVKIFNSEGIPLVVDYVEHYPPDTQAASLWLRNRQPKKWRDKVDHEHSGELTIHVSTGIDG